MAVIIESRLAGEVEAQELLSPMAVLLYSRNSVDRCHDATRGLLLLISCLAVFIQ
jgi:hypothetical protein